MESYIPSSEIYYEAGGVEKLGDSIGIFFKKLQSNSLQHNKKYSKYYRV
nr:MAG TPA: hypothetical protein [Caudoviricetes sp.]